MAERVKKTTLKSVNTVESVEKPMAAEKKAHAIGRESGSDLIARIVFFICAAVSVLAVVAIVGFIFMESFPAFREIGVINFLFGMEWLPGMEGLPVTEKFGIFPMIMGTLAVTAGAVVIGGALGVLTAVFMAFFCPKKLKGLFQQVINLLAGIPSIVYGFFGLIVVVPMLDTLNGGDDGKGILACSLILAMMILPTVASITRNSLESVPQHYFDGALALGNTKEQAIFKVILPAAKSGILSGLVLGVGRAIGETMAVMLVAGNSPTTPGGLFTSMRTLTINIALEMSYAAPFHKQALIATGFVLLVFALLLNFSLGLIKRNKKPRVGKETPKRYRIQETVTKENAQDGIVTENFRFGGTVQKIMKVMTVAVSVLVMVMLAALVGFILIKGVPNMSFQLLFGESGNAGMTLGPAFVSTGMLIGIALGIAIPLGIGAAIYLVEYAKRGSRVVKAIRLFTDTLAGIPSIVFGLFGMIVFCTSMKLDTSVLAGGLTLAIMILPTVIRSTEESFLAVQDSMREGSLALGAGKVRTIFRVVIPSSIGGIVTAIILSIGRIVGESAALIYTAGAVPYMPSSPLDAGSSFAVMMYTFANEGMYLGNAYATAAVLLIIVFMLNMLVTLIQKIGEKNQKSKIKN